MVAEQSAHAAQHVAIRGKCCSCGEDNSRVAAGNAPSFSFRLEEMVGAAECGMKCLGFVGACQCSAPTACPLLHSSGPRLQAKQEKKGGTLGPFYIHTRSKINSTGGHEDRHDEIKVVHPA